MMILTTNTMKVGGTIFLRVPPAYVEHLELKGEDDMLIEDKTGPKGKFATFWKKDG